MDTLIAKISDLSYDFFGILLPGFILNVLMLLVWLALGLMVPLWTGNGMPEFTIHTLPDFIKGLASEQQALLGILLPFVWYFLGHLLNWVARSGPASAGKISGRARVVGAIIFRIPKPNSSFDSKLEELFKVLQKDFSPAGSQLTWGALFPIFRTYVVQRLSRSLITTYQNKYTLHRSITTASAILFWASLFGMIASGVTMYWHEVRPHWEILVTLGIASLGCVWGFSGSYLYNWTLFGNSIVTETYSLLHSPKDEKPTS